jgi:hypothetical protein
MRKVRILLSHFITVVAVILASSLAFCVHAAVTTTLFSGGFEDSEGTPLWQSRFREKFSGDSTSMAADSGEPIINADGTQSTTIVHNEAQRIGVIGADFTYAADITVTPVVEAHLQFRISDEGRYGAKIVKASFGDDLYHLVFYAFLRDNKSCDDDPSVIAHCPLWRSPQWQRPADCEPNSTEPRCIEPMLDTPTYRELGPGTYLTAEPDSRHRISIQARGADFHVSIDGQQRLAVHDNALGVGRFGVYVWGTANRLRDARFSNLTATTDPTWSSNFALLYNTAGYELSGTKRALVRTLNDLPLKKYDPARSGFMLLDSDGRVAEQGPLKFLVSPRDSVAHDKTFGMQLWEADFSSVTTEDVYTLHVDFATASGIVGLDSAPFEVMSGLVSQRMLKPLSIRNAEARRAADEDMRRNWCFETAATCTNDPHANTVWSVALDGAFVADRADAEGGAVLRRVFNDNNAPLNETDFHLFGRVTIISGCDAQLQFGITPTERWAVTLQAGEAGGCPFGGGPGAVRLSREYRTEQGIQFDPLTSALFSADHPFEAGRPYDIEIRSQDGALSINVVGGPSIQNIPVKIGKGGFGLKAWASTARFENVQAWKPSVDLHTASGGDGTLIPYYHARIGSLLLASVPCQFTAIGGQQDDVVAVDAQEKSDACNPLFSQLDGFHDANNIIGEATSHGTFLAGLMDVWSKRASQMLAEDRESLRRAIVTAALYVEELYQECGATGEFAHSEMGRGGVDTNLGDYQSKIALYGETAFADKGEFVDRYLAARACGRSVASAKWLEQSQVFTDPTERSVIYARIARCVEQYHPPGALAVSDYRDKACSAAKGVIAHFLDHPGAIGDEPRDTGRVFPWFEGVYEVGQSDPLCLDGDADQVKQIANILVSHLTQDHICNDKDSPGPDCGPNGFFVLPQGSGPSPIPKKNWVNMERVPEVNRPTTLPFLNFYNVGHFATSASDAAYLWRMTGITALEPVATGNLYWILGLNPGVPSTKVVGGSGTGPWQAASFVYNQDHVFPFARTFQAYRTEESSAKGWIGDWELSDPSSHPSTCANLPDPSEYSSGSPHRETWWIDPLCNSFMSIVNGHVLWDQQWDYWNSGHDGWSSGETFILNDGAFIKAALLIEGLLHPGVPERLNPYDTSRLEFFDTTHVDREDAGRRFDTTYFDPEAGRVFNLPEVAGWSFDSPDRTGFAYAGRAATEFCSAKGYTGGRFTGHFIGEKVGLLCMPKITHFFDATDDQIRATNWGFTDINTAPWAQISRAATGFCNERGYVGGFFSGHQLNGLHGVFCLGDDVATWYDSTEQELADSEYGFDDINTVPWAQAARAATNICLAKGYAGGFFTGHQLNDLRGVVCLH